MPTYTAAWSTWTQVLKDIAPAVSTRPTLPVLAMIKVTGESDRLILEATDLETSICRTCVGYGSSPDTNPPVTALLPYRQLQRMLKAIATGVPSAHAAGTSVDVEVRGDTLYVQGFGRRLQAKEVAGAPLEDYPKLPDWPTNMVAQFEAEDLVNAIRFVAPAAGGDKTLPMLTAISVTITEGAVELAATDRCRLAIADVTDAISYHGEHKPLQLLLGARELLAMARAFHGKVEMRVGDDAALVSFLSGETGYGQRTMDASFPSYHSLIPKGGDRWDVNRARLLNDVKAAASVTDKREAVRVTFGSAHVMVAGCDIRHANSTTSAEHTAGFNPRFLEQGLAGFASERVLIEATSENKPHLIRGSAAGVSDPRMLLMPVRLPG